MIRSTARMKGFILATITWVSATCILQASDLSNDRTTLFSAGSAARLLARVCYRPPEGITGYWLPKEEQLPVTEIILEMFLQGERPGVSWDWSKYARQVAGIEIGKDKLIFISYFLFDPQSDAEEKKRRFSQFDADSWGEKPYSVCDGGPAFFRVVYDPVSGTYVWVEFNGNA
jgi:hypothetical protein